MLLGVLKLRLCGNSNSYNSNLDTSEKVAKPQSKQTARGWSKKYKS